MSDLQAVQYALVENLPREDLNPIEETLGILQLLAINLECEVDEVTALLYGLNNEAKGIINRNVWVNSNLEVVEKVFALVETNKLAIICSHPSPAVKTPRGYSRSAARHVRIEYTKAGSAKLESVEDRIELLDAN
jgi:ParB family chromosome partitioning protein